VPLHFDGHVLDLERRELHRGGQSVPLEPQVFDLLVHLVRHRDRVVSKNELLASVWGGRNVSDTTIDSRVKAVRQAVGDSGAAQRLIRTIPRRGVRFVGAVTETQPVGIQLPQVLPNDRPSIAVLAFDNLSGDAEQEYFADGMVEEITTALSKVRWFFVISRNSSFAYKGRPVDVKQVGRDLGVRYVIEGSVRKSGDRVRITAQLIEATTGNHVWAERYDRDLGDFFAIQDEITECVVAAIEPRLHAAESVRSRRTPPENLDAWECVMRALLLTSQASIGTFATAEGLCRRAITLEPSYSQAHSLLAWILIRRGANSDQMAAALTNAAKEAQIAVSLDEQDPWAHLACGFVLFRKRNYSESESAYRQALELNPNLVLAHAGLGNVLAQLGNVDSAIAHGERALRLCPGDRFLGFFAALCMAMTQFIATRYTEAAVWAHKVIELRPGFPEGYRWLAAIEAWRGNLPEAVEALAIHTALLPGFTVTRLRLNEPLDGDNGERFLEGLRKAGLSED
jgi:TolB-like protein